MKKLLWRCDDFGAATGVNEAILRLARRGLSFNVSVLVCAPEAQTRLRELAHFVPQICLGIHAAINSEWSDVRWGPVHPRTRSSGLVDAHGYFHPDYEAAQKQPPELIAFEIEAQIKRAQEWGFPFSYLDEHMGFGWLPGVSDLSTKLALAHGLVYRRDLPCLPEESTKAQDIVSRTARQLALVEDEEPRLAVFHPAVDDESTRKFHHDHAAPGVVSRERQSELDALASDEWRNLVTSSGVQLVTYKDL